MVLLHPPSVITFVTSAVLVMTEVCPLCMGLFISACHRLLWMCHQPHSHPCHPKCSLGGFFPPVSRSVSHLDCLIFRLLEIWHFSRMTCLVWIAGLSPSLSSLSSVSLQSQFDVELGMLKGLSCSGC